jgi:hypothetical protein
MDNIDKLGKKELLAKHKKLVSECKTLTSEFEFIQKTNSELYQKYRKNLTLFRKVKDDIEKIIDDM